MEAVALKPLTGKRFDGFAPKIVASAVSTGNRRLKCELRFFDKSLIIGSYGGIQMRTFLEELKDKKKKPQKE